VPAEQHFAVVAGLLILGAAFGAFRIASPTGHTHYDAQIVVLTGRRIACQLEQQLWSAEVDRTGQPSG